MTDIRIRTRTDLIKASQLVAEGKVDFQSLTFPEYLVDTIKIYSEEWGSEGDLNYKAAGYITSVQQDVINLYNTIFKTKLTIDDLDDYEFLIVKFVISDGCIQFLQKFSTELLKVFLDPSLQNLKEITKDMTPQETIAAIMLMLCIVGIVFTPTIISAIKQNKVLNKILDSNEKLASALSNQKTENFVINNIGSGSVTVNGEKAQLPDRVEVPESVVPDNTDDSDPITVDDYFKILQYNLGKNCVRIQYENTSPFWADTQWLTGKKREQLKSMVATGIENKCTVKGFFNLTCKFENGKVASALVEGIDMPMRRGSKSFLGALNLPKKGSDEQFSLPLH